MDEKWSFVGKKQKNCDPADPADAGRGDRWDHVAFDPEHRLVLGVVPGPRTAEHVEQLVQETKRRLDGRTPELITTDEYAPYRGAILKAWGRTITPPRTGKRGRPCKPYHVPTDALRYAMVHKTREKGRVVKVEPRVVFGDPAQVEAALKASHAGRRINTAFIERYNGTDRHRCARKARRTYRFSKRADAHDAATRFSMYSYNFCWPVRTLAVKDERGRLVKQSPAMAAGLTDHLWTLDEWTTRPAVQRE